jgi:hypothetical protein
LKKLFSIPLVIFEKTRSTSSVFERAKSYVILFCLDGIRIAQNTPLGLLIAQPFQIRINESLINVQLPPSLGNFWNSDFMDKLKKKKAILNKSSRLLSKQK